MLSTRLLTEETSSKAVDVVLCLQDQGYADVLPGFPTSRDDELPLPLLLTFRDNLVELRRDLGDVILLHYRDELLAVRAATVRGVKLRAGILPRPKREKGNTSVKPSFRLVPGHSQISTSTELGTWALAEINVLDRDSNDIIATFLLSAFFDDPPSVRSSLPVEGVFSIIKEALLAECAKQEPKPCRAAGATLSWDRYLAVDSTGSCHQV